MASMDARASFAGKKITVMGLGLLGRGVGDARYLAECGAELIVTDLKSREALAPSLKALSQFPHITFVLGEHRLEDFKNRDLILKAAGVPLDSPYINEAKKNNIPVRMSADLFMEMSGVRTIGITGTRGKSTVTHMINAVLKEAGTKTLLGGNVRGVSNLSLLNDVTGGETAVLELDSWQCHGLGEAHLSPHVAVFTTFYPDHQNYYKNDMDAYLKDKAQIFLFQTSTDIVVLGSQCAPRITQTYNEHIQATTLIAGEETLPTEWTLSIPGTHNRYNAGLALSVARVLNMPDEVSKRALESFTGVAGRLEFLREVRGVKFYNDTTATVPEATLAALRALSKDRNVVLIMGGADKGLDMNALLHEIPEHTKRVIMLSGTGTSRVLEYLPGASVYDSLQSAFDEAVKSAAEGDIVLLSPAFASFGMFTNEYDRGDQYNALVGAL